MRVDTLASLWDEATSNVPMSESLLDNDCVANTGVDARSLGWRSRALSSGLLGHAEAEALGSAEPWKERMMLEHS